jgi:hypothetical protein
MTDPNIFDPTNTEPNAQTYIDYVVTKYGTENPDPELAKAIFHKDQHIEQIHREQAGLRQELNSRMKMEEFLDRMNTFQQNDDSNDTPPADREHVQGQQPLSTEDVQRIIEQRDAVNRRNRNLLDVTETLKDKLGPNYPEKVRQTIRQLGMDEQQANTIAADNPKAFYRLLGIDQSSRETFQSPPRTALNSEGFRPSGSPQRDWNYYENIRKTKPNEYWSPRIQNEIFQLTLEGKLDPNS